MNRTSVIYPFVLFLFASSCFFFFFIKQEHRESKRQVKETCPYSIKKKKKEKIKRFTFILEYPVIFVSSVFLLFPAILSGKRLLHGMYLFEIELISIADPPPVCRETFHVTMCRDVARIAYRVSNVFALATSAALSTSMLLLRL